jgi:hypothetical protein
MSDAESKKVGFRRERRAGMIAIAAAMPVAILLWFGIAYLAPPLTGIDTIGSRMLFALKCVDGETLRSIGRSYNVSAQTISRL